MAEEKRTVNTVSGGQHTTMQAAEDWFTTNHPNFVTSDIQGVIECAGSNEDTATVNAYGLTVDATRYLTARQAASDAHNGSFDTGKYRLGGSGLRLLQVETPYFDAIGLQFSPDEAVSYIYPVDMQPGSAVSGAVYHVAGCIVNANGNRLGGIGCNSVGSGTAYIYNNILFNAAVGATRRGIYVSDSGWTVYVDNNIIHSAGYGIYVTTSDSVIARNNIAIDDSFAGYSGVFAAASSNNIADDTSAPGSNSLINQVATDLMTDPANGDFTLESGSNAIGAGIDLSAYFTTDITGATRSAPWDIGAHAAPTGGTVYSETINSTLASITSATDRQNYKDTADTLIQSGASLSAVAAMLDAVVTLATSSTSATDQQDYVDDVDTTAASASSVTDQLLTSVSETVLSTAVSASAVDATQSYVDLLTSLATSASSVEVIGEITDLVTTVATSLSSVVEQQQFYSGVATVAIASSSVAEVQAFIDQVASSAQSESTVMDVLVSTGWLFEPLELVSPFALELELDSPFVMELELDSPFRPIEH